jgi:hypothetical protein
MVKSRVEKTSKRQPRSSNTKCKANQVKWSLAQFTTPTNYKQTWCADRWKEWRWGGRNNLKHSQSTTHICVRSPKYTTTQRTVGRCDGRRLWAQSTNQEPSQIQPKAGHQQTFNGSGNSFIQLKKYDHWIAWIVSVPHTFNAWNESFTAHAYLKTPQHCDSTKTDGSCGYASHSNWRRVE